MSSYTLILIAVIAIYLIVNMGIGIYAGRRQASLNSGKGFVNNYFIGGRSMGGLVLAMTLIATFTSASSFVGGPGVAFSKGLVWVYLSVIQIPTAFIILGILGKKFAIISRKTNAVTVTDFLRARYKSPAVVIIASLALVGFFIAQMMSQFIGGAVLFESVTGVPYVWGLVLFGIVVIVYTTIGGFKAVSITDTIQGIVMVIGAFLILFTIIGVAGGFDSLVNTMNTVKPEWADPYTGGTTTQAYVMSFWVLVGIGVLGLPQTAVRGMGFKDTKSLHNAMIYGTIVVGLLMLVMHISGAFAPAILDINTLPVNEATGAPNTDYVIPTVVLEYMNPVVAGLFIAAPLSAVMSTVSSLLILASAAIVKDLYLNYVVKDKKVQKEPSFQVKIARLSMGTTLLLGVIVFVFTISPPDLIVWINLFAMGGLECTFLAPIIFGLYWKKANATGALCSMIFGIACFLILSNLTAWFGITWSFLGTTAIVPSVIATLIVFVVASLIGKKSDQETLDLFFGDK